MRPVQCHTLCLMFLVIDCKGLNRDDGLDLSQLMNLLFPSCSCDEVVFGKGVFTNLSPIHARNTDGEAGLQCFGITTPLIIFP